MIKNNLKKIVFFGSLSSIDNGNKAYAASANQVQIEIIKNIRKVFEDFKFEFFGFAPYRTWPFSNIYIDKQNKGIFSFHSYLNILGIRELHIFFQRINYIIFKKPDCIFLYNISFLEALVFSFLKKILKIKIVLFIQDINQNNFIDSFFNILKFKLASYFDILIPISQSIIDDFKLPIEKSILFQGGCTEIAFKMQKRCLNKKNNLVPKVVFAGRLDKYNGIDKLLNYWIKNDPNFELHIYGTGSCEFEVIKNSKLNSKIKFFGNVSDIEIFNAQQSSVANVCLRYSINLNQNYFFPSKIFNIMSSPGTVILNNFNNLSEGMIQNCKILDDDFGNFQEILNKSMSIDIECYKRRVEWLKKEASWYKLLLELKSKLV